MRARRPGEPTSSDRERLAQLAALLAEQRGRLKLVDYRQAEADCDRLAARLLDELGRQELERSSFRPIPRGGLFVLGMLAYLLNLRPSALLPSESVEGPLVLVDDCAITGARFRSALEATSTADVIFAHLYSPAALRAAIEKAEPRVRRCVSAHDLRDRTAEMADSEREAWFQRWRERLGPDRYFYGRVDPVAFSWTEPDQPLWNRATEAVEPGWRLVSPAACLRNRGRLGQPPTADPRPAWRVASEIASAAVGDRIWLCAVASGDVIALEGTAAEIWRRLSRHGDPDLAAAEIAEQYGIQLDTVQLDLHRLVEELAGRGFVESIGDRGD